MDLFVIRHAEAVQGRVGRADQKRKLTPRGHRQCAELVHALDALDLEFDLLLHSPWLRAVQTADAVAERLSGESRVSAELARSPDRPLLAALQGKRVAVIGHEPWLSELIAWLVAGDQNLSDHFPMKKSGVAWLKGEPAPGKMSLRAILPPRALRRMSAGAVV